MADATILIIDDEEEFAATLSQRLNLRGFESTDIHSGTEGLARFRDLEPDIVILDLKMPDMSGLDVLAEIKKHDPSIEVIMVTGHGSGQAGRDALKEGAFDYIMKPVDLKELLGKIHAALEKQGKE